MSSFIILIFKDININIHINKLICSILVYNSN